MFSDTLVLSAWSGELILWDVKSQNKLYSWGEVFDNGDVVSISISTDDKLAAVSYYASSPGFYGGPAAGLTQIIDLNNYEVIQQFDDAPDYGMAQILPNCHEAFIPFDEGFQIWDIKEGQTKCMVELGDKEITGCAVSSDSSIAIIANYKELNVWDLKSGQILRKLADQSGYISDVFIIPDTLMAIINSNGELKLWDLSEAKLKDTHQRKILSVEINSRPIRQDKCHFTCLGIGSNNRNIVAGASSGFVSFLKVI